MVAHVESVNFDRAAEYYDATRALPADTMAELTSLLAGELRDRQPCLEIGVGTGRIALPLHHRGITMVGLDIADAMLRRLVANAGGRPPFPLLLADATRPPVAAASFGSVLAVHVLHLIPDWRVAVDEAIRMLRPGGALLASFPGPGGPRRAPREATEGPPWAAALREALAHRGIVRADRGPGDPAKIASYLQRRATARALEPVIVREARTLSHALSNMEQQLFSWTWPYTQDQMRLAGSDVRAWAARENVPLDAEYDVRYQVRWWAFEVPRLASRSSRRSSVCRRLLVPTSSRASSTVSQRSSASGFSGRTPSGFVVAMKYRRSACSCAGSPLPGATSQTTACRTDASGHGSRSGRPVSSPASRNAIRSGSVSPGSPCPPTCSHIRWRWCQRNSTRPLSGCTTNADAVKCSGSVRSHGSGSAAASRRIRSTSAVSVSPCA